MPLPTGPVDPIKFVKVISSLPGTLVPNAIYAVRVGSGVEIYVVDMTGSIAYRSTGIAGDLGYTGSQGETGYIGSASEVIGYTG